MAKKFPYHVILWRHILNLVWDCSISYGVSPNQSLIGLKCDGLSHYCSMGRCLFSMTFYAQNGNWVFYTSRSNPGSNSRLDHIFGHIFSLFFFFLTKVTKITNYEFPNNRWNRVKLFKLDLYSAGSITFNRNVVLLNTPNWAQISRLPPWYGPSKPEADDWHDLWNEC